MIVIAPDNRLGVWFAHHRDLMVFDDIRKKNCSCYKNWYLSIASMGRLGALKTEIPKFGDIRKGSTQVVCHHLFKSNSLFKDLSSTYMIKAVLQFDHIINEKSNKANRYLDMLHNTFQATPYVSTHHVSPSVWRNMRTSGPRRCGCGQPGGRRR